MKKIPRQAFLKTAAATAMSGVTAAALAACNSGSQSTAAASSTGTAGLYIPGTYTATETGTGPVTVTMTFSDSAITEVQVDTSKETIELAVNCGADLQEALLAAQSSEVDSVAGATNTSKAVKKAAASCIEQAMGLAAAPAEEADADDGTPKWLGHEPEIADSDITATYDTEVLVVGGGTGGLFAACSAGENGAKTLVIDKVTSGGVRDDLGAIDSRYQKAWGTKIDKFEYITEMTKIAAGHLDQRLVKLWAEESADPNIPYQAIESGMLPGLVESGFVFQCDTIAELAEKLGLPADALEATVARYNELYDKGVDEDFGKEAHRMSAVRKAPFYGAKNTGYILCTMDGIQIDLNMNAVDTNNEPIPGLYVVGNDSGGYFSGTYPNLSTGAACGRTVTFGRRAGRIAATRPL